MGSFLAKLVSLFQGVDSTFSVLLALSIVLFLGGEVIWHFSSRSGVAGLSSDDSRLKFVWSLIPAFILVVLLFVHSPRLRVATPGKPGVRYVQGSEQTTSVRFKNL